MNRALILLTSLLPMVPAEAAAQSIEGQWANPKRSAIVKVERCGAAYCGAVSWANEKNKDKVAENGRVLIGMQILSDLQPVGDGSYKGNALEPKRNIRGSATVRQIGPNVMMIRGCVVLGLLCREQRWTRVTGLAAGGVR